MLGVEEKRVVRDAGSEWVELPCDEVDAWVGVRGVARGFKLNHVRLHVGVLAGV